MLKRPIFWNHFEPPTYPKIGRDLALSFEDLSKSEQLSEIKPTVIATLSTLISGNRIRFVRFALTFSISFPTP